MRYQKGQEFLIRSDLQSPPYKVRIIDIDEKLDMYHLQKLGHRVQFWLCEVFLDRYIADVDRRDES